MMLDETLARIVATLDGAIDSIQQPGLGNGATGLSLFYSYYGYANNSERHIMLAEQILESSLSFIDRNPEVGVSLSCGLIGIAWTIHHLNKNQILKLDAEDFLLDVDKVVFNWSCSLLNSGRYDYLNGGLGGAIYLFERLNDSSVSSFLRRILDVLLNNAVNIELGIAWPDSLNKSLGYNLSVSHGQLSILAILSLYYEYGIETIKVKRVALKLMSFIHLNIDRTYSNNCSIPSKSYYAKGRLNHVYNSRSAWCYGDLGASLLLYIVGKRFDWIDTQNLAKELVSREATKLSADASLVKDICLCHGSAGNAYLFNKWYTFFPSPIIKRAIDYWNLYTSDKLSLHGNGEYKFWQGTDLGWQTSNALFEGLSGVGLSILSQTEFYKPPAFSWDRILLLS